jgi:membrane protein involved in colicin uptake
LEAADDEQRAGGRDQHADAIGRDIGRHPGGLFAFGETLDAKRIDHDILRRGHGRYQQRAERDKQRRARRVGQRQQQYRTDQQQLRKQQPAASATERSREERHMQRVDQRRPQELQRVRRADQRKQPDGAEIDTGFTHPHQQR